MIQMPLSRPKKLDTINSLFSLLSLSLSVRAQQVRATTTTNRALFKEKFQLC